MNSKRVERPPSKRVNFRIRPNISLSVDNAVVTCLKPNKGDMMGIVTLKATAKAARAHSGFADRASAALIIGRAKGKKIPLKASGTKSLISSRCVEGWGNDK